MWRLFSLENDAISKEMLLMIILYGTNNWFTSLKIKFNNVIFLDSLHLFIRGGGDRTFYWRKDDVFYLFVNERIFKM